MPKHDPIMAVAKKSPVPAVRATATAGSFVEGTRVRRMTAAQRRAVPSHRAPSDAYTSGERERGRNADSVPTVRRGGGQRRQPAHRSFTPPHSSGSATGALLAEWLFGVVLIGISVPLNGGDNGYGKTMQTVIYRLTALTGVFFFLALVGNSERASRPVVYFGAIIDLGILFTATGAGGGNNTLSKISNAFSGKSTLSGGAGAKPVADVSSSTEPTSDTGLAGDISSIADQSSSPTSSNNPVPA